MEEKFSALLHQHRTDSAVLSGSLEELQEENEALKASAKDMKAILDHQDEKLKALQKENHKLTHSSETYSQMEAVLREQISTLSESKKTMQKEIRDLQVSTRGSLLKGEISAEMDESCRSLSRKHRMMPDVRKTYIFSTA